MHFIQCRGNYAIPYDPGDNKARVAPTKITDNAVYAEDSRKLTSRLNVVTGIHFETFYLDRLNFGPPEHRRRQATSAAPTIPSTCAWERSYDLYKGLTAYGQFTTANAPPGSHIFLVNNVAGAPFQLSGAKEGEIGPKTDFPHRARL